MILKLQQLIISAIGACYLLYLLLQFCPSVAWYFTNNCYSMHQFAAMVHLIFVAANSVLVQQTEAMTQLQFKL
jgi:hypothetical protein